MKSKTKTKTSNNKPKKKLVLKPLNKLKNKKKVVRINQRNIYS